jgi:tRNA-dihydrouridine synthase
LCSLFLSPLLQTVVTQSHSTALYRRKKTPSTSILNGKKRVETKKTRDTFNGMDDDDWGILEKAWAAEFRHAKPHTSLPALLAKADKAVAAAVESLTEEYERTVGRTQPRRTNWGVRDEIPLSTSALPTSSCSLQDSSERVRPNADEEALTASPVLHAVTDGDEVVDWAMLYASLCLIQAPMVRCSRPAFRQVCRLWGTRISYTHMLVAESFVRSPHARHAEFALYSNEDRLVVQLAAKAGPAAAQAATLVRPYCDAVDLNCGCPQRWAMKEGIGAALLEKPEVVADMIRCIRNATPEGNGDTPALPCVVKMRVQDDLRRSVDFARHCEAAGAAWVTVHGRTPHCQPSAAVQFEAVRRVRESLAIPVVLNGGVSDVSSAMEAALRTGCGGLMAANGLLDNPSMFYCGTSAASMSSEVTFEESNANWATAAAGEGLANGKAMSSSPFTPIRPVTFSWAPQRSSVVDGTVTSPPPSPTRLRFTIPTMWEAVVTPREVVSDFMRCAIRTDLAVPTTVQQVLRMARMYVSPAERNHFALLRSNLSVLSCLQEIGVYVEHGHIGCE